MKKKLVSIVVPTYKEAENIYELIKRIDKALKPKYTYEVVIVDDNSNDGIDKKVELLQKEKYNVNLKIRTNERGLSSAVIAGLKVSKGEIFLVMDADLSHPPEKIPEMIDQITLNDADFVIGSRFVKGGGAAHFNWFRRLNAWVSKLLARPFSRATDPMAGLFAFSKYIIDGKYDLLNPLGFKIGLEIIVKCSPKNLQEIPIQFQERLHGESKLCLKEQLFYVLHIMRLYEYKYQSLAELIKFSIIGGIGTIINLLAVFITFDFLNISYMISLVIGFVIALTANFALNRKFTFANAQERHVFKQYLAFSATCILGFCVNWIVAVYLFKTIPFFHKYYLLTTLIGIVCGLLFNFIGSKFFVFRKK